VALTLFSVIATAQIVGALVARSLVKNTKTIDKNAFKMPSFQNPCLLVMVQSLLADAATMCIDVATYAGNIYAEVSTATETNPQLVKQRALIASGDLKNRRFIQLYSELLPFSCVGPD
jgi:hypothetical protein